MVSMKDASSAQLRWLAITPKITGYLSLLSSLWIIADVLLVRKRRGQKIRPYHHILLGMSLCDCLSSVAFSSSTWPIPPDVLDAWGASGTQTTCELQGFFIQFSITATYYNFFLALNYYLSITRGWTEAQIKGIRFVPLTHGICLTVGAGASTIATAMGKMNPLGAYCWISTVPLGCQQGWSSSGNGIPCIRGDNALIYQWAFFRFPLLVVIISVTWFMWAVLAAYRAQMRAAKRWNFENQRSSARQREQRALVVSQSLLYAGSFYVVWAPSFMFGIHAYFARASNYHVTLFTASIVPLQGVLNVIIYSRPKCIAWWRNRVSRSRSTEAGRHQGTGNEEGNEAGNSESKHQSNQRNIRSEKTADYLESGEIMNNSGHAKIDSGDDQPGLRPNTDCLESGRDLRSEEGKITSSQDLW